MTPVTHAAAEPTASAADAPSPINDYERRRREVETVNELVVSAITAALMASMLVISVIWTVEYPFLPVPPEVRLVSTVMLVAHLGILAVLATRRYSPLRKYVIVVVRMALLGGVCWAEWFHRNPAYGLVVPTSLFAVTIMITALSYSRGALVLAGVLACILYPTISLLGPAWPASLHASLFAVQLFIAVTYVAHRLVSQMRTMSDDSVSNERLSRFFSPQVAAQIATEPALAIHAAECQVSVLMSDISGFTAMASRMPPDEVVGLLNAYFPRMVAIVFRHGGTLEKFIGDALLAVWGAPVASPDHADRAVAAATEMQQAVAAFNVAQRAAGRPTITIHVGIASGPAAAGYIGADRYVQYAVMGDTTNVAARICTSAGPDEILVSDATRRGHSGRGVVFEDVPAIVAKGKDGPVTVHRVRAAESR
jgi:class 3 adenylate cyclase